MPSAFWQAAGLLALSNVFSTFAWYAHLKTLGGKPWLAAALVSWGIALVTLLVFAPFVVLYMKQGLKLDYLWAALCIVGTVYFVFRSA